MQVQISGKQVAVGDALMSRIESDVNGCIGKYFERGGMAAEVVVGRDGYAFRVDCVVRLASGQQLDSHGAGPDAHAAFDAALAKIERRIRRYKRRIKNHHRPAARSAAEATSVIVLHAPAEEDGDWDEGWDEAAESGTPEPPSALVIAEARAPLRTMTVAMAVLELDLTESQTIVFRNAAHGGLSVVYRRPDGNIGWMDPERPSSMNGANAGEGGGLSLRPNASRNGGARGRP